MKKIEKKPLIVTLFILIIVVLLSFCGNSEGENDDISSSNDNDLESIEKSVADDLKEDEKKDKILEKSKLNLNDLKLLSDIDLLGVTEQHILNMTDSEFKYYFKKVHDVNHFDVKVPTLTELKNMDDKQIDNFSISKEKDLLVRNSKSSQESKEILNYLNNRLTDIDNENYNDSEENSIDNTDEIKKSVSKVIPQENIIDIISNNDSFGNSLIINFKGTENISDKLTKFGFKDDIKNILLELEKNENIDLEIVSINVQFPIITGENTENQYVIKSKFDIKDIKSLSHDEKELLNNNLENVAIDYEESY